MKPDEARRPATAAGQPAAGARAPVIQLPKGGGAIRGIGETLTANPVTGTGSMSVPILTSAGRAGLEPRLSLSYDSGVGNGPFGLGWSLALPSVTRKTDKRLPQYHDAAESDVFILSGAEDLVPAFRQDPDGSWVVAHPGHVCDPDGSWVRDASGRCIVQEDDIDGYRVRRYRPRVEGLFARVERWTKIDSPADVHWRSISSDDVLTVYGRDASSRVADPLDPRRIFQWLVCEVRDDKGNVVLYRYKAEDGLGVDLARVHERNRGPTHDARRTANRYPKRVLYGNRAPLLDTAGRRPRFLDSAEIEARISAGDFMLELVFDYGDHDPDAPRTRDDQARDAGGALVYPWKQRPDPFSSYRSGFEIRTTRLCQRILMFHHFPAQAELGRDCLVRSTDFTYSDELDPATVRGPVYTFLRAVAQTGYRREGGGYRKRSLPPVELEYSMPAVQQEVEEVDPGSLENLPAGVAGSAHRWVDLHGEGAPGILTEEGGAWFYKRNLSPVPIELPDGREVVRARFAPLERVAAQPNASLSRGAELMDLGGDGRPDVVLVGGPTPGVWEHDEDEGWLPFHPFDSLPSRDLRDPSLRLVDLDGDGYADILITEDDTLVWHPSLGSRGFGPARRGPQSLDEEKGPRVVFADASESIHLADLSGDGLTDIVRIRNGEICYWPNLGHGRFGPKVTMDGAPRLDHPDQFDPARIRLADIDGSGTTDIIYLHRDGVRLYFNQSGNGWSEAAVLRVFPRVDNLASVAAVDLLGDGTTCLVWSSPAPTEARRPMRYVSLVGGRKPHLLVKTSNNLGAETRLEYAPSTKFYASDARAGVPWVTRLPFPVHVVERVETYDHVSHNRFVTRYAYHHGFYDAAEREFRGFGMVEQWDTEQFGARESGAWPPASNLGPESYVAPVHTKSWFHTGVYVGRDHVSDYFAGQLNAGDLGEYFREPGLTDAEARELLLPDTTLPPGLTADDEREACRALRGKLLRQEVYADDAGPGASEEETRRARTPYRVTEQCFAVRLLQPRSASRHAVFFTHPREVLTYHYERNAADPRVLHVLTLEVDAFGNVRKQATVGHGRRSQIRTVDASGVVRLVPNPGLAGLTPEDVARQTTTLVTYTENGVTNAVDSADTHRTPLPCEARTFELTGYAGTGPNGRFVSADLVEPDPSAPASTHRLRHRLVDEVPYEGTPTTRACRRPIEWLRTVYRRDDLTGLLPLGELQSLALPGESYELAFTPGLLAQTLVRPHPPGPPEPLLPDPAAVLGAIGPSGGGFVQSQTLKADGRFAANDPDDQWWVPRGRTFFSTDPADSAAAELARGRQHFFVTRRYRDPFGHDTIVDFDADDLLPVATRDALGNRVTVEAYDYRVLQPRVVADPNGNRSAVAFDALGMVVATALIGKPLPVEGDTLTGFVPDLTGAERDAFFADPHATAADLLRGATTRVVYDLERFYRTRQAAPHDPTQWRPPCTATLARETHASGAPPPGGLRIRLSFSYSDGFGREIQKKAHAEPGSLVERGPALARRWVGSGWMVLNNKGKPVRQYEPFFSSTHQFELDTAAGVSRVLFYDPPERVVATLHADHTYEKVVFDAWRHTSYDRNDTCAPRNAQTGDPRTDPDIGALVARYFASLSPAPPWQTWHAQRIGGALGADEQAAATQAAAHADTPTTIHLDSLGRTFLTVQRNRVVCAGHDLDGAEDAVANRVELDIEGNQRVVRDGVRQAGDALGRVVVRHAYDMLGHRIHQSSMETGARWMLEDVGGKPIRSWDSRGHAFVSSYDALRRPVARTVRGTYPTGEEASDPRTLGRDVLVEKVEYGEPPPGASAAEEELARSLNLRTRVYRRFDSAGIVTNARLDGAGAPVEAYDFKGNPLHVTRRLVSDYHALPDWQLGVALEAESFESSTRYDALDRPIQSVLPHSNLAARRHVVQPAFNEADLLERVDVWLERAGAPGGLIDPAAEPPSRSGVAQIDYDAKGQRLRVDYANGASTRYRYDPTTFRLTHLYTRRGAAFADDCENASPPPPTVAAPDFPPDGLPCGLQNLRYTYDPAGNVVHVRDDAQQTIYFRNQRVEPSADYTYDALYQLVQASGREHLGQQAGGALSPPTAPDPLNAFHTGLDHPNTLVAMGRYLEQFVYDAAGNLLRLQHRGSDPAHVGWTRAFEHTEASLVEDGSGGGMRKMSNRLTRMTLDPNGASPSEVQSYAHDAHGNIVRMPHLSGAPGPNLHWDHDDGLGRVDLGGGGTAYYVYDASGERVRKVWEKAPGLVEERIYLGGLEIFRRHPGPTGAGTATRERETVHVMDDQRRVALVEIRTLDTAGDDPAPARLVRLQLANHLGSACLELDDEARIITYEEYAPYGSTTYQAVRSQTETPKRYRYAGKERDDETGLACHGARYYAHWLARWVSPDPAGLIDGPNPYRYAHGNPLNFVDPTGEQAEPALDPETIIIAATALQRAAQAWGAAAVVTGGAATIAPAAAPALAPATVPATAPAAGSAFALLGAHLAAAAAMALALHLYMTRAGSIVRYGNPYGMPSGDIAFPVLRMARRMRTEPFPVPEPAPDPAPEPRERKPRPRPGRVYVTYTKYNSKTKRYYSGRTSAVIDLNLPWRPQAEAAVRARDANHHIDENDEPKDPSFGPAVLDQFTVGYAVSYDQRYRDVGYLAIRGREQQLIDYYGARRAVELGITNFSGGARSDTAPGTPLTENAIRGVGKDNPLGEVFHAAATLAFGELAPFTGNKVRRPEEVGR